MDRDPDGIIVYASRVPPRHSEIGDLNLRCAGCALLGYLLALRDRPTTQNMFEMASGIHNYLYYYYASGLPNNHLSVLNIQIHQ